MNHGKIEIYASKGKTWLLLLIASGFIAAGIWMFRLALTEEESWIIGGIGAISVLFFGICFLFILKSLFDSSPVLEIDDGGLLDRSSYIAGGRILWTEVEAVTILNVANQPTIGIRLRNPQAFLDSQNGIKRWLISVNQKLTGAPVNISRPGMTVPIAEIYKAMLLRWEQYQ
ncbi:STM3941 family protein [Fontibacillus sp. BL9]|uniref:STM3941 family protein n=1 Tax=Fontibacillus sp. BL9 TaxID=3389971 RepID=UPI00397B6A45